MAVSRPLIFLALLAVATTPVSAQDAKDAKMAAVNKVISMLEELQTKVLAEGEEEAASYNEFACFCKDTSKEKTDSIKAGEDDKDTLTAMISKLSDNRDTLDTKIQELVEAIEAAEKELKEHNDEHAAKKKTYEANHNDLQESIAELEHAEKVEKASAPASLIQLQSVAQTVRKAVLMADALGLASESLKKATAALLQEPEVPMANYDDHSGGIVEVIEKLEDDFHKQITELDEDWVKVVAAHDMFVQEKTDFMKRKNQELADTKEMREQKIAAIESNNQELTTTQATILDDQTYLKELTEICSAKAKTWDQRSKMRQDELSALTAATAIIKKKVAEKTSSATIRFAQLGVSSSLSSSVVKSDDAMEAIEASVEETEAPASFLQKRMQQPRKLVSMLATKHTEPNDGRELVMDLLNDRGKKLKSTLLTALASQIAVNPFKKITKLIQELIERLLQEAANEANQKGFCDKALGDAEDRRNHAATAVEELNNEMATLEATRDKLTDELAVLTKEIAELKAAYKKAETQRAEEKAESEATITEANAGLEAVEMAIDILDKFYKTAANKAEVDPTAFVQQPSVDMPDSGFDAGETYAGGQGASTGILGMLDVIKSDFIRTISMTEDSEAEAEKDFDKFDTETKVSLAEKQMAVEQKTKQKDDAVAKLESADSDMSSQSDLRDTAIKELIELQPACVDTGMSYEERVARREQEMESLKKALCILEAYAKYGPDGIGDKC